MAGRMRALAVVVGFFLIHSSAGAANLPNPTHTSKTRFRIPFKFDAVALKRMNAREVQLHVSLNQGETWELAQVLKPDGGKFEYNCSSEGEFWFAVKTLDGQNQLHPPRGSYETGLIVVVDHTQPLMDIVLQQTAAGRIQARWKASDSNLDINSLRLEYLAPNSKDWSHLDVVPRARGETSWNIGQTGIVSVRGSISDAAGNVAQSKVQIEIDAENYPALKQRQVPQGKIATKPREDETGRAFIHDRLSAVPFPEVETTEQGDQEFSPDSHRQAAGHWKTAGTTAFPSSASESPTRSIPAIPISIDQNGKVANSGDSPPRSRYGRIFCYLVPCRMSGRGGPVPAHRNLLRHGISSSGINSKMWDHRESARLSCTSPKISDGRGGSTETIPIRKARLRWMCLTMAIMGLLFGSVVERVCLKIAPQQGIPPRCW